ncbi:MAG: terpene cyclase/mutase family protein [Fimbriiglobus sp.]|jgi:squalene cyclase|nr:terpene cyclase/mutase family protein [Fimbriiglobus sp.]
MPSAFRTLALVGLAACVPLAVAQEKKPQVIDQKRVDDSIARGLEYLRKTQNADGSWASQGGMYPTTMTGMAGLALLMEGSTCREGKYAEQISKAVDWYLKRSQPNGLLGTPQNPTEGSRYTYGHGYGMLFLACVYGEEEDPATRKKLETLLKKAVDFSCKAVTKHGGWGYVSAAEGGGFDEGSTTVTQLQALRAARNAGIPVPKETIDNAIKYLKMCTTPRGGLIYNYSPGGAQAGSECPGITAAATASACSTGMYKDKYFGMWVKYCKDSVYRNFGTNGHDEYSNLYFGQTMYMLGDDRYQSLIDPESKDAGMKWSDYKKMAFNNFLRMQSADGGWQPSGQWGVGPIFATATALILMQQEKEQVPFFQR